MATKSKKEGWSNNKGFSSIFEFLIQRLTTTNSLLLWSKIQFHGTNVTHNIIILISAQLRWTLSGPLARKCILLGGSGRFLPLWTIGEKALRGTMDSRGKIGVIDWKFGFGRRGERPVLSMIVQRILAFASNTTTFWKKILLQIYTQWRGGENVQDISNSGPFL